LCPFNPIGKERIGETRIGLPVTEEQILKIPKETMALRLPQGASPVCYVRGPQVMKV